jgi:molecular chaperone DnaJ
MSLSVKLTEAILGGKESIELLDGSRTTIKIPSGLQPGQVLRIKGKGVPGRGDLLIETKINIPGKLSRSQKKIIEQLQGEGL